MKFPKLLHIGIEEDRNESYFVVLRGGVSEVEDERPIAIYKLVEVGRVSITKVFVGRG